MSEAPAERPPRALSPAWAGRETWQKGTSGRELDLWRFRLTPEGSDDSILSPDEKERFGRLIIERKRIERFAARTTLRLVLSRYLDRDPAAIEFTYGEHGHPSVRGAGDLVFNLSHSADVAIVGVASGLRLGVDVEERRADRRLAGLARRFFAASETRQWQALPENRKVDSFYRTWCRKEAYLKAWGTGLSFSSRLFEVSSVDLEAADQQVVGRFLRHTQMPGDHVAEWSVLDFEPYPGFAAAACWRGGELAVRRFDALG